MGSLHNLAAPPGHIRAHGALRGVAAILVVAYHLQFGAGYRLPIETATHLFQRCYLGVDLFFVLSGFIIAYVNAADRGSALSRAEAGRFFVARFTRLYPLLAFSIACLVLVGLLESGVYLAAGRADPVDWSPRSIAILLAQLTLVNAWSASLEGWNIPTWSISAEVFAYALFPLIVAAHARMPRLCATIMLVLASFYAAVAHLTGNLDIVGGPMAPLRCLAGFMIGMLLYYGRGWIARRSSGTLSIAQLLAIGAILAVLAVKVSDPLIVPAFAILVGTSFTDRGLVARLLASRPLLKLGELSYSIYLNHFVVMGGLGLPWGHFVKRLALRDMPARCIWIMLVYGAVIGLSLLTFRHVERPGRQWLALRLAGRRASPIETSPAGP